MAKGSKSSRSGRRSPVASQVRVTRSTSRNTLNPSRVRASRFAIAQANLENGPTRSPRNYKARSAPVVLDSIDSDRVRPTRKAAVAASVQKEGDKPQKKKRCKLAPTNTRGNGSSRPFIPHCKKG